MAPRGRKKNTTTTKEDETTTRVSSAEDESPVTTRSMMTRRSQSRQQQQTTPESSSSTANNNNNKTTADPANEAPAPKRTKTIKTEAIDNNQVETVVVNKIEEPVVMEQVATTKTTVVSSESTEPVERVNEPKPNEVIKSNEEETKVDETSEQIKPNENESTNTTTTTAAATTTTTTTQTVTILTTQNNNIETTPPTTTTTTTTTTLSNGGIQTTTIKLVDPPPSEVFLSATEANLIAEANQRLQNAKSGYVLTDPLGQDTSSESSGSEDAETDEENDDSGSGSKKSSKSKSLKSVNGAHRSSSANGVLNKSKIDTEFIAKLIPNKDPNDKRYDLNEINKLRLLSHSYQNFSVKLLTRLFDEEEIIGRNVYGRNYSGDKTATKQPLDPERINFIKETVLRLTKTNNPELAWASCVIAMNRKMVDINNKYAKMKMNSS